MISLNTPSSDSRTVNVLTLLNFSLGTWVVAQYLPCILLSMMNQIKKKRFRSQKEKRDWENKNNEMIIRNSFVMTFVSRKNIIM